MRKDLLTLLADHLEKNVTDEQFDMEHWWCDTVGCALGHACSIPELRKEGLYLASSSNGRYYICHGLDDSYDAATRVFGISYKNAEHLFSPAEYREGYYTDDYKGVIPRLEVITRIREFVDNH